MLKVSIIQRAHLRIEKFESDIWEHLQLELIIKRITISAVICDKPLCIITRKAIAKKQKWSNTGVTDALLDCIEDMADFIVYFKIN